MTAPPGRRSIYNNNNMRLEKYFKNTTDWILDLKNTMRKHKNITLIKKTLISERTQPHTKNKHKRLSSRSRNKERKKESKNTKIKSIKNTSEPKKYVDDSHKELEMLI